MIIDCKELSIKWQEKIKERIKKLNKSPHLVVILVGNNPASISYVKGKNKDCDKVGIKNTTLRFDDDITEVELLNKIDELNNDNDVDGILVQLPLPKHISSAKVMNKICLEKDVDGFHLLNVARLALNEECIVPCTPKGIMQIFLEYNIDLTGKNVVIIGRSNIVGKPMSYLMVNNNATVTICHSKTDNIQEYTKNADIIVIAIGKEKFLKDNMIKDGVILIDVGINRVNDKLIGDIDFESCFQKASYITKVPGGVGLLTRTALLENIIILSSKRSD